MKTIKINTRDRDRDRGTHWDTSHDADRLGQGHRDDFGGSDVHIEYSDGDVDEEEEDEHPWRGRD